MSDKTSRNLEIVVRAIGKAHSTESKSGPTVTSSGQIMWSTRDLLFPTGRAARTISKKK